MATVSRGEITITNVNDGKPSYTHTAYAWSADGTDRFTREYPGENLLPNSMFNSQMGWTVTMSNVGSTQSGIANGEAWLEDLTATTNRWKQWQIYFGNNLYPDTFELIKANPNKRVTLSVDAKVEGNTIKNPGVIELSLRSSTGDNWVRLRVDDTKISSEYIRYTAIGTLPSDFNNVQNFRLILMFNGNGRATFTKPKLAIGNDGFYTPAPSEDYENAYPTYTGTYTDYTEADSTNPADYTWVRILGEAGQNGKDGIAGKDGIGIKSTAVTYALADSGDTAPTSGWTATVPTLTKGRYLWTKSVWTYTDNSTETGYSVTYVAKDGNNGADGIAGKDGVGIKSTAITYAASTSGTTAPTTGWTTTVPTVAAGSFLWTKTVWTYTDSTTETGYSVAKMGENGSDGKNGADGSDGKDGVGIASTAITYQASSDGTTAPTGPWLTTIPTVAANQYLWTRTVITYTNNTNSTAYSVGKMGANGTNGTNGKDGADGVSVSSVVEEYYVSTSPTGQAGGSWSTTVPNNSDPNKYVWRRMKTTLSNGNVTYTNPALIQGMTGIYPYIGPSQPANPKEGQQWWKSDASGNITDFLVYKSGSWQGQTIQQSILNIVKLNAVEITGSVITGTTINSSVFNSSGEFDNQGTTLEFTSKNMGTIETDWKVKGGTQNGKMIVSPAGISSTSWTDAAKTTPAWFYELHNGGLYVGDGKSRSDIDASNSASYGLNGITITNKMYNAQYGSVALGFQDLMTLPQKIITNTADGWAPYATEIGSISTPTCERKMRQVQLSGAFRATKEFNNGDTGVTMATLPVGYRPSSVVTALCKGSSTWYHMVTVYPDGRITTSRYSRDDGKQIVVNSWMKIDMTFVAGDI